MSKYIAGFLIGVVVTLVIVSVIYPNVQTDIQSGNFWYDANSVITNWFNAVKEQIFQ